MRAKKDSKEESDSLKVGSELFLNSSTNLILSTQAGGYFLESRPHAKYASMRLGVVFNTASFPESRSHSKIFVHGHLHSNSTHCKVKNVS